MVVDSDSPVLPPFLSPSHSFTLSLPPLCRPVLGTSVGLWLFGLSSADDLASPTTSRYRRINEELCRGVRMGGGGFEGGEGPRAGWERWVEASTLPSVRLD